MANFIEEIGKIINSPISISEKYHLIEKCFIENSLKPESGKKYNISASGDLKDNTLINKKDLKNDTLLNELKN